MKEMTVKNLKKKYESVSEKMRNYWDTQPIKKKKNNKM